MRIKMHNPPHPGKILISCFDENFTVADAAKKMGVSENFLLDIIAGKSSITLETAILLNQAIPLLKADFWLALQSKYDQWQATHNKKLQKQILAKYRLLPENQTLQQKLA